MCNDFFLDAVTNLEERDLSSIVEPVFGLLKLVCNLKPLSCKQFIILLKVIPHFKEI